MMMTIMIMIIQPFGREEFIFEKKKPYLLMLEKY